VIAIPEDWTRNAGDVVRPLCVGMEVRLTPRHRIMTVVRSSAAGTTVESTDGARRVISTMSEVEYRRVRTADERRGEGYVDPVEEQLNHEDDPVTIEQVTE